MDERLQKFLVKALWVALGLFVLRCWLLPMHSFYDFFGDVGEVASITILLLGFYEKVLWKYDPFEKMPNLNGTYDGIIEYNFNEKCSKKDSQVRISQSLFFIKIETQTNEITSQTITSNLIEENGEFVLYYTYITNPSSKYSEKNPVQYGTCRLTIRNKGCLCGTYWTSRKTIGDITLKKRN